MLLGVDEAGDGAGNAAGEVSPRRETGDDLAVLVLVHVGGGCGRGFFAVVEEVGLAAGFANEHEAAAA